MNYLFFDIECSNCFNGVGKMCEFGYVLTDEKFKVLSAFDIPMSPGRGRGNRFHLRDRMEVDDIELAYDEEYYFEQPEFPYFYYRIKRLMEDKNTLCFAFSMNNDIRYLHDSCQKYGLEDIDYICYDIQKLASKYLEIGGQPGLKKCVNKIVGPHTTINLIEHLSRDDAKMEMMVMEAICFLNKIDSKTLLDKSDFAKVNSLEFIDDFKVSKERKQKIHELSAYVFDKSKNDLELLENEEFKGKRYAVSHQLYQTTDEFDAIYDLIHQKDGLFTRNLSMTDIFIVKDEEDLQFLKKKTSEKYSGDFILMTEFINNVNEVTQND